ncbi:MAG: zinc ribbon domain-containing protein [Chloroflexota bacterium]
MSKSTGRTLLALQEVDRRLTLKRQEHESLNQQLETQAEIPSLRERVEEERSNLQDQRARLAKVESDQDAARRRVDSLEERKYGGAVTSVRELDALEEEQAQAQRDLLQAEEALGPARRAADESERRLEELTHTLEERERTWTEQEPQVREQISRVEEEIRQLEQERETIAGQAPQDVLRAYEHVRQRRHGVSVARVERGVCQACHIALPLKDSSRLRREGMLLSCGCGYGVILISD